MKLMWKKSKFIKRNLCEKSKFIKWNLCKKNPNLLNGINVEKNPNLLNGIYVTKSKFIKIN